MTLAVVAGGLPGAEIDPNSPTGWLLIAGSAAAAAAVGVKAWMSYRRDKERNQDPKD